MKNPKLQNVVERPNKDGSVREYRREIWRDAAGKPHSRYHGPLPPRTAPNFASELARINAEIEAPVPERVLPESGTIAALIREFRPTLAERRNKDGTKIGKKSLEGWATFLRQVGDEHGDKVVAEIRAAHLERIRRGMSHTPGKANAFMSRFKVMLEFAAEDLDWIPVTPLPKVKRYATQDRQPWPSAVLESVLNACDEDELPVLRAAIVSALCSGQRISDVIRMRDDWHDGRVMRMHTREQRSRKTNTAATIPMMKFWLDELAVLRAVRSSARVTAVTLLYGDRGGPFANPKMLQKNLRKIMRKLGHVDEQGLPLYTFHGLSKNAICYLAEQNVTDEEISAIVGKTVETVRYYAKDTRKWMLAEGAAHKVTGGTLSQLMRKNTGVTRE